jgi:antitoxin MazE
MRVAKWGNSLAVRLPAKVVKELELAEGDEVELRSIGPRTFEVAKDDERAWAVEAMRRIRARSRPLPPGWKFDRDEANERGGPYERGDVEPDGL